MVLIMELQDILDHTVDHSIVQEERIHIKERINSFNFDTPFYVYCLCFPNGQPFYIGKGKNYRIFDHFKSDFTNKNKTEVISDIQQSGSCPIMHIIKGNLSEEEALLLEQEYIRRYGRVLFESDGILTNIHPGGSFGMNSGEICSMAGRIGGKITGSMPWWNNGYKNTKSYECPGENWVRGMIKRSKSKLQTLEE